MAKKPAVVIGMGEMGSVFARGLLRLGHPVYPARRGTNLNKLAEVIEKPALVLVAVGEKDLATTLQDIPKIWRKRLVLLQNELLPADYAAFKQVTVISVWFEKKKGQEAKVIIPSPAYGPRATKLADALATLDIPVKTVDNKHEMLQELVVKNLYILTTNIAGLKTGGTVGMLWAEHRDFARRVANDVIRIQEGLTGTRFENEQLIAAMVEAFNGDTEHNCMGRSAPARLARALDHAKTLGIEVPTLQGIADETAATA